MIAPLVVSQVGTAGQGANYEQRAQSDKILCPALKTLYNYGQLQPDEEGLVTLDQLHDAASRFGLNSAAVIRILGSAAGTNDALRAKCWVACLSFGCCYT